MTSTRWHDRFFESTRGRVLGLLRREDATVEDLAAALHLTDNAVRAHLVVLERDGLIRQNGVRRGAGKPAYVYEVAPEAERLFPKADGIVLGELLDALGGRMPHAELQALMRDVGRALSASWRMDGPDLESRLSRVLGVIARLGGSADLEEAAGEGGQRRFVIRGHGCPLAAAGPGHPEICDLMEALVADLVGARVRERCDRGARPACCFEVTGAELTDPGDPV